MTQEGKLKPPLVKEKPSSRIDFRASVAISRTVVLFLSS